MYARARRRGRGRAVRPGEATHSPCAWALLVQAPQVGLIPSHLTLRWRQVKQALPRSREGGWLTPCELSGAPSGRPMNELDVLSGGIEVESNGVEYQLLKG